MKKRLLRQQSGQAMVEMVLIAITYIFVILGVIQLALVANAYTLVRYAAYNAARAAIVHGGDNKKMKDAARMSLLAVFPVHGRADHLRGTVENYIAAQLTDSNSALTFATTKYYFQEITNVKILDSEFRDDGEVVTFDDPADAHKGVVTVQVTHLYELVIPLVNRILFYLHKKIIGNDVIGFVEDVAEDPVRAILDDDLGRSLDYYAARTHKKRKSGGSLHDIEYRIPIVAHYSMRLQSDYKVGD